MNELVSCIDCGNQISDTAIRCPICGRQKEVQESTGKKIGLAAGGTAAVILTGPAGVAAALLSSVFDAYFNRSLRKEAIRLSAIDSFFLGNEFLIFVTENEFVLVLLGAGGPTPFPGFLRSDFHKVYIDEEKSRPGGFLRKEKLYFTSNILIRTIVKRK